MKDHSLIWLSLTILIHTTKANHSEDDTMFVFPDDKLLLKMAGNVTKHSSTKPNTDSSPNELPIDLVNRLNEVDNYEDVLAEYLINKDDYLADLKKTRVSISSRFGNSDGGRGHSIPLAKCVPREEIITVTGNDTNASHRYIPSCVAVNRCSGCCFLSTHSCQPTEVGFKKVKVTKIGLVKNGASYKGYDYIEVKEHLKCACSCKRKAEECNSKQVFKESSCSCHCRNNDSYECDRTEGRVWNFDKCKCECEETRQCSSGERFNHDTCECDYEEK